MSIFKFKCICTVLNADADYILFGTSSRNAQTVLSDYTDKMTTDQIENLLDIVRAYAKTCGIES